ncbi:Hsp70 family protein [Leucobacter sp. G161]|uniref:Hsp70 family protein n=1 Tax=Leucobacter sp. G161 TaxID=663704 RepID=UPI00073CAD6F|nr:Hsp70 family protein [Leucobacter sp. G161]KUF06680.1 molecular chaperone [Leucobacter sp. G161]
MAISIGIDLGTTYSCVIHYASDGTEQVIVTDSGGELTPSVVHISGSGDVTVGEDAKELLLEDPDNVVVGIKRHMGKDYPLEYAERTLTPEGISALILSKLAADAATALGVTPADLQAVITVPAYFGIAEKEATAAAARIANLDCPELLPEPVAAAYSYGLASDPTKTSLVYDLGGGTFDVAVVGIDRGQHRVWAVDGESKLGGLDWDERIQQLMWEEFDTLEDAEELRFDEEVIAAIHTASERIKRKLTGAESVTERIRVAGRTFTLSLTREGFIAVTQDLMLRSLAAVDRVLQSAQNAGAPEVDQILLVGGSTRMPMIRQLLAERFSLPVLLTDPDKAVARGAAIHAEQLLAARERRAITVNGIKAMASDSARITSVLPRSIGVLIHTSRDPYTEEPYVAHFIHANTPLPVTRYEHAVATMVANQEHARIQIFEQAGNVSSSQVADNRPLIEGELSGIPASPAGSKVSLWVTVSADGRVRLEATAGHQQQPVVVEAFMHGVLDETEVSEQRQATSGLRMRK